MFVNQSLCHGTARGQHYSNVVVFVLVLVLVAVINEAAIQLNTYTSTVGLLRPHRSRWWDARLASRRSWPSGAHRSSEFISKSGILWLDFEIYCMLLPSKTKFIAMQPVVDTMICMERLWAARPRYRALFLRRLPSVMIQKAWFPKQSASFPRQNFKMILWQWKG
jgi:hypothetical protein